MPDAECLMPGASVAIVADDLTGAGDAALGFFRAGYATAVVSPDIAELDRLGERADVVAVDLDTRGLDAARAVAAAQRAVADVRARGVPVLYKKIDSMLRGHIGDELRGTLAAWGPESLAVVAPAFPTAGRTTVGGMQRIHGNAIEPSLPARLRAAGIDTRLLDLQAVRADALRIELADGAARGVRAIVCDAETDADLTAIVQAARSLGERVCWVGSGGLAGPLARALRPVPTARMAAPAAPQGPTLVVVGTTSEIAREQVAALAADGAAVVEVPLAMLRTADDAARERLGQSLASALRDGRDLVVTIELSPGGGEDADLIGRLGQAIRPLQAWPGTLVVTGGTTARAVFDAWGIRALRISAEVEAGMPICRALGRQTPLTVITKPGAFGDRLTLVRARRAAIAG